MDGYITSKEAARKWGISDRRVQILCNEGRINGATKHGWSWAIPDSIDKPKDARNKRRKKWSDKMELTNINGNEENNINILYEKPLPSTRTGALYNAFSYPTKISPETISLFIATHTNPGDTILDTFSGSGTTGLATLLCDKPNDKMLALAKEYGLNPKWGPRKAILHEISTLGAFIADTMCNPPEPKEFEEAANDLLRQANQKVGQLWMATDEDGNQASIRYAVWSDILKCPNCGHEITFWDAVVNQQPLKIESDFKCKQCSNIVLVEDAERVLETVYDEVLDKQVTRKKRVIVRMYGQTKNKKWKRSTIKSDIETLEQVEQFSIPLSAPKKEIMWGDLHRSGYHKGISHLHHFYTKRSFITLCVLWDLIEQYPHRLRKALKMLILSYNTSHSTLMTRIVVKNGEGDFVVTSAQPGVLYMSSLPVEKNILDGVKRKIKTFKNAFGEVYGSTSNVNVVNKSSRKIQASDKSVNYIFTDPPFGDYIPYSELNQINEIWLGETTDSSEEIIISKFQNKDVNAYGRMMGDVFKEIARVLTDEGKATVVFHSAKANVWDALMNAYSEANLEVEYTSVLDKLQSSFKQTVSNVSVKGDPLILFHKCKESEIINKINCKTSDEIFDEVIKKACDSDSKDERTAQRLYSRYISRCLELGIKVSMDANTFYGRVEQFGVSSNGK